MVQLPCVRTLKYYIDANLEGAGDCTPRIKLIRTQYEAMLEKNEASKKTGMIKLLKQVITVFYNRNRVSTLAYRSRINDNR